MPYSDQSRTPEADRTDVRFGRKSVRARMFLLVAICAIPAVLGTLVALGALSNVHAAATRLDERSVKPLAILGDLRDQEGDMRAEMWAFVAGNAKTRAPLNRATLDTDHRADTDIARYLAANGSDPNGTGNLMEQFQAKLAVWRQVRDQQVFVLAVSGKSAQAYAAANGSLAAADDAMAKPLDALFTAQVSDAAVRSSTADNSYNTARFTVLGIIGVGLLLAVLAAWWLTVGMLRTIRRIRTVLASGDADLRADADDGSELGSLALALDAMLDEVAARDAAQLVAQQGREYQLRETAGRQSLAEHEVRQRAQKVIDDTARSVLDELETVATQAQAVRFAASTIESRVEAANEVSRSVVHQASTTDTVVSAVSESLRRVGGIAKLIAAVAAQTNLLALNATIEAARAGDAGKGFAVVASEVKELAATTERSTTEISKTLATLESDAAAMAAVIHDMTAGIGGLDAATGELSSVASEQQLTAELLDRSVADAIDRIRTIATLTDRLDRRHTGRVRTSDVVGVTAGRTTLQLGLLDISDGGVRCLVAPDVTLEVGTTVQLKLASADVTEKIRGRVVRREPGTDGDEVGMVFVGLNEQGKTQIVRYIHALFADASTTA